MRRASAATAERLLRMKNKAFPTAESFNPVSTILATAPSSATACYAWHGRKRLATNEANCPAEQHAAISGRKPALNWRDWR